MLEFYFFQIYSFLIMRAHNFARTFHKCFDSNDARRCLILLCATFISMGCAVTYKPEPELGYKPAPDSLAKDLRITVSALAEQIGERNCYRPANAVIVGMITPDDIGSYSTQSQRKRTCLAGLAGLPARPDYVAFLSNRSSRRFARECATIFQRNSPIEVRTVAFPAISDKVAWSDDWSFWQEEIPAFAVTDTAFLRHDDYHELTDTAERLDYETMAQLVWGLRSVIVELGNPSQY